MHFRLTTLTVILASTWAAASLAAQSGKASAAPYVRFSAHVVARTPTYTPVAGDTALIFEDDPIGIEVSLVNKTGDALPIGMPGNSWVDDVRLSMVALPPNGEPQPVPVSVAPIAGDWLPLPEVPRDGVASGELRVQTATALGPGRYRLTVALGGELARQAQAPAARELHLEIRKIATLEERLDDLLQQAFFASREDRFDEAAMWASRAAAAHPLSVIALAEGAQSRGFDGRCSEGVPMLRRAIGLMHLGGDPLLVHRLPDSYTDFLQTLVTRCKRESR